MKLEHKKQAIVKLTQQEQEALYKASNVLADILDDMEDNLDDSYGGRYSFDELNNAYWILEDLRSHIVSENTESLTNE